MKSLSAKSKDHLTDLRLRRTYNITIADYLRILKHQGGKCAICNNAPKATRLALDHNHLTGHIRGLLCMQCNRALGRWRDNDKNVINAAAYVQNYPATLALGGLRVTAPGRVGTKKRAKALRTLAKNATNTKRIRGSKSK